MQTFRNNNGDDGSSEYSPGFSSVTFSLRLWITLVKFSLVIYTSEAGGGSRCCLFVRLSDRQHVYTNTSRPVPIKISSQASLGSTYSGKKNINPDRNDVQKSN